MRNAIAVTDDYASVVRSYVDEGQAVRPGADLLDLMTPWGVVETIHADCYGIVAHIEGNNHPSTPSQDRYQDYVGTRRDNSVYFRGDIVCPIVSLEEGGSVRKTGLHPKPSQKMRAMRLGYFLI